MGFKEFLKSAPEEGGEEITQYSLENAINKAVAGNTAKWASMTPGIEGGPYEVDMRVKLVQNKGDALKNNLYYFTPEEILSIKRIDSIPPTGEGRAQHLKKEGEMLSNDPSLPQGQNGVNTGIPNPAQSDTMMAGDMGSGANGLAVSNANGAGQRPVTEMQMMPSGQNRSEKGVNPGARPTIRSLIGEMPTENYQVPRIDFPKEVFLDENMEQLPLKKIFVRY